MVVHSDMRHVCTPHAYAVSFPSHEHHMHTELCTCTLSTCTDLVFYQGNLRFPIWEYMPSQVYHEILAALI